MSNIIQTTTELAIHMVSGYAKKGGVFADATCGNGHDTLRLAKMGPSKLYAFDIQPDAIENTRRLLISEGFGPQLKDGTIELIRDSHENMRDHIGKSAHTAAPVDVIIFNLGYLPGGDKHITTGESSTRKAAEASLTLWLKMAFSVSQLYSVTLKANAKRKRCWEWPPLSTLAHTIQHTSICSIRGTSLLSCCS